jgi:hypothetical protein
MCTGQFVPVAAQRIVGITKYPNKARMRVYHHLKLSEKFITKCRSHMHPHFFGWGWILSSPKCGSLLVLCTYSSTVQYSTMQVCQRETRNTERIHYARVLGRSGFPLTAASVPPSSCIWPSAVTCWQGLSNMTHSHTSFTSTDEWAWIGSGDDLNELNAESTERRPVFYRV